MKKSLGNMFILLLLIMAVMVWTVAGIYSIGTTLFIDHSTLDFIIECTLIGTTTIACYALTFPLIASQLSLVLGEIDEKEEEVGSELNTLEV